jgi:hypothetical protein
MLTTFDAKADMFVLNKISAICAQINLQLDELHTVEDALLHSKGITARRHVCGTTNYSHWYKTSKGHITVMHCGNIGLPMTGKVRSPQMLTGAKINHTHPCAETESNTNGYRVLKTDLTSIPTTLNFGLCWNREDCHRRQFSQQIMPLLVQMRLC